jgi:hypothetical protein
MPVVEISSMVWQVSTLVAGAVLTGLILAVEHWFPWVETLPRVQAYTWGTLAIWAGFTAWRLLNGDWVTPAGLMLIAMIGGAVVVLAYKIDAWIEERRKARKAEQGDDELAVAE